MSRVPTAVLAALTLVVGFAVAELTDVRALGGVVLVAGVVWCAVRARSAGWWRVAAVVLVGAVCFALVAPARRCDRRLAGRRGRCPRARGRDVPPGRPARRTARPRRVTALLVCCGLATLDVVQVVDRLPAADEKIVARSLDVTFGGPAANAAATAAALGVRTVLVTALGTGPVADLVRSGLAAAGVEVVDLLDGPGTPAVSTVLVTRGTGERAVVSVNAVGVPDLSARARALGVHADATTLLVDGHHLGAARVLAADAAARGVPVLLDGGSWKPGLDELLAAVDHAVLSADFRLPDGTDGSRRR